MHGGLFVICVQPKLVLLVTEAEVKATTRGFSPRHKANESLVSAAAYFDAFFAEPGQPVATARERGFRWAMSKTGYMVIYEASRAALSSFTAKAHFCANYGAHFRALDGSESVYNRGPCDLGGDKLAVCSRLWDAIVEQTKHCTNFNLGRRH